MGKEGQPGLISMGNFSRESILYFNRKSQIYNNCPILVGKNEEAELNGKEGRTRGSFQWEITSLGVLNWMYEFLAV